MSIWSRMGLADAASMAAMKEEILALRQENRELHEAQAKQSRQLSDGYFDYTREAAENIEHKVSEIGAQLNSLQPALAENLRDSQQEILSAEIAHRNQVLQQVSVILANQELLKKGVSSMETSRDKSLAQITDLLHEIRALQSRTITNLETQLSELASTCQVISGGVNALKETAQAQNGIEENLVAQLDSWQIALQKILSESQGVTEDISFLKKYTESLWEAMKLVWINDLIDNENNK